MAQIMEIDPTVEEICFCHMNLLWSESSEQFVSPYGKSMIKERRESFRRNMESVWAATGIAKTRITSMKKLETLIVALVESTSEDFGLGIATATRDFSADFIDSLDFQLDSKIREMPQTEDNSAEGTTSLRYSVINIFNQKVNVVRAGASLGGLVVVITALIVYSTCDKEKMNPQLWILIVVTIVAGLLIVFLPYSSHISRYLDQWKSLSR
uniref:PGG domain-containing protein n=1 Tax=Caenorhabditis tropicalis TaxID=1561998 RepID=A0A1I7ULG4_9PELO